MSTSVSRRGRLGRSGFIGHAAVGLVGLAGLAAGARADVTPQATMLRYPDVSADKICFVYANNIWVVPRGGGAASPIASPPGAESFPKFSPDGQAIGFVGNYDGNRDLYTISVAGGIPNRVTHHPAGETLSDWTPDGKLLFLSNGLAGLQRQTQLFTVSPKGGMPDKLPVPYGAFASISPNGEWLAYTPHTTDNRTWKRYRGGMATDVWLFNLKTNQSRQATDWEGTDSIPMWVPGGDGKVLYYLSDNGPEHRLNIWSFNVESGARKQITAHKDNDVRWPSVGPGAGGKGEIVFQLGSELRLLDLATEKDVVVKVTIPGDRPTLRTKAVEVGGVSSYSISPSGKRVVIEGRGDIWSAPAKEGVIRNLTRTDGEFERDPSWSPDGKWIAYFSDKSGEYELWVRASDSKPAEEEKKADDKKDKDGKDAEKKSDADVKAAEAKDAAKKEAEKKDEKKPEPRKLTNLGAGFRYNPTWSPDSKMISFTDQAGRLQLTTVETGETKLVDTDPYSNQLNVSWSSDSQWMTYGRSDEDNGQGCVWLYNVKTAIRTRVTDPMFSSSAPAFDRKGEFLYFTSNRAVNGPTYSDIDSTYAYTGTGQMFMLPLRKDVKNPFAAVSDEEQLKKEEPKKDEKKDDKDKKDEEKDADKPGDKPAEKSDKPAGEEAKADDGVSGTWACEATGIAGENVPAAVPFTVNLKLNGTALSGSIVSMMGGGSISSGSYNASDGSFTIAMSLGKNDVTLTGTIKGGEVSGSWASGGQTGPFKGKRTVVGSGGKPDDKAEPASDKPSEDVKIDLENMERRVIQLPMAAGAFGGMAVNDSGQLVFARFSTRGAAGGPDIKIFDPKDEAKEEKLVTAGAGGFAMSADGKKLAVPRGSTVSVLDASAGGGKPTTVSTGGLTVTVNPRNEWRQIFNDVWRLNRDFFYEPTMHGVNWPKMREHYGTMIEDCVNREDVAFVYGEMISELNIGHAYVSNPGDTEGGGKSVSVGLLGCDFELVKVGDVKGYKVSRIIEGGPWDVDARGPLSQPGIDVKVGDFILAVNGAPVDVTQDPWAAFVDTAGKTISLTYGPSPVIDNKSKEVLVKPIGSEASLRYRAWVQRNREYVQQKSDGKIGYCHVPSTGVDGQDELYRQFFGERGRPALLIDERWNAGGQIPNRFIELLNRPVSNYWAKRDGKDWVWPQDGHNGPKAMLINGLAGSGGDCFPWMFRQSKLGKLIGTRTWGGLVGISGNPGLIDGGVITVPTFGFYKRDGTWAVEGHGVDPDMPVIDDPAKMVDGGDPQLDAAIEYLLGELKTNSFVPVKRPASPDRSGMGIPPEQR